MERFGPYETVEPLGHGGMGVVYRAVDTRTREEVALKVLVGADASAQRRLVLEARALTKLRHRNVVSILDAGEERGRPWIALELVRGQSLQERLDRGGPLPPREAAQVVHAVGQGLAHAHREGVLHRDVKPANVLLSSAGEARLVDFGLASFLFGDQSQSRLTRSGTLMGSPGYWSPEQATGQVRDVSPATDVYGLGALLYAALTGRPPIEGDDLIELITATQGRAPDPPRVDPFLDELALRCLAKQKEDRPPSVDSVVRELSRYLANRARAPRRRRSPLVAPALVLVLVALVFAFARRATPPPADAAPTPPPATVATSDVVDTRALVQEHLSRGAALRKKGDLAGAIAAFTSAIALAPDELDAYAGRADARMSGLDAPGAIADAEAMIARRANDARGYFARGLARLVLQDDPIGALADQERAVELEPLHLAARTQVAIIHFRTGDTQRGMDYVEETIRLAPGRPEGIGVRAMFKSDLGDHAGSLVDVDRALELEPDSAYFHGNRAMTLLQLGEDAKALVALDRALELDALHGDARLYRAIVRHQTGDLIGAVTDLNILHGQRPTSAVVLARRGMVKLDIGDLRNAATDLERALALEPDAEWAPSAREGLTRARGDP